VRGLLVAGLGLALAAAVAGCSGKHRKANRQAGDARAQPAPQASEARAQADAGPSALCDGASHQLAPGLELRRLRAVTPPEVGSGDRCVTMLRADPGRFRPRLLTVADGGPKRASDWGLVAAVNAALFHDDGRGIGLMVARGRVVNGSDNPKLGGYLAFDPRRAGLAPLALFGRDCEGFDLARVRADYATVVQSYRLLDCAGQPIAWQDDKSYSAAAVGIDSAGWLVMLHVRTPYRMTVLARELLAALPELRGVLFVEGGPEASLYASAGGRTVAEMGSFETGFTEDDLNHEFWPLPNVIGLEAR